jgi:REP element-mobilizing transposase RayT
VGGYISRLFPKIMRRMPGCEIIERNIQVDHIHLIIVIPPKYAVSDVIGEIKQYTARKMREKFCVVRRGLLEGAGSVVTRLFCLHSGVGRETNH